MTEAGQTIPLGADQRRSGLLMFMNNALPEWHG